MLYLFSDMAHSASRTAGYQKTIRHLLAHPLDHPEQSRLIPVAFELIPKLPKLPLEPSPEERARHQANSPSVHALQLLKSVRQHLRPVRRIYLAGDGFEQSRYLM